MSALRTALAQLARWRHLPLLLTVAGVVVLLLAWDAEARVGGGSSYSGSGRRSGGGGSGGGGDGGGGLIFLLLELFFSVLPWPIKIVVILVIIFVFFKARRGGATLSYGQDDDDDDGIGHDPSFVPFGGPPARYASHLPPSWGKRGRALDPAFSEVLFLERAVLLMTRLFEAAPRKSDLEAMAPYLAPDIADTLARRSEGVTTVRGVVVGQIALVELKPSTTAEGAPAIAVRVRVHLNRHLETAKGAESPAAESTYSHEEWSFVRAVAAKPRDESNLDRFGCPGCGSPLERDSLGRCTHCASSLAPGAADWSVRAVRVLDEEKRGPLLTSNVEEVGTDAPTAKDSDVDGEAATLLAGGERERFVGRVKDIFVNLQGAWTRRDLAGLRPFETDSLFQSHRFWIEEYLRQGLRNVIDRVQVKDIELCRVERDGDHVAAVCRIHASCLDYVVDEKTQNRVSGSPLKRRAFTEYWTFVKHHDAKGSTDMLSCPSCGAKLSIAQTGVCEFCQSKLTLGRFDWVASRIEQDEEIVPPA
ncbi:MAG: Tim44-like domain-containing protein [Deltaproteobacteria bacterium]|nr:Tim44-like domain-containing protein [Deltaproteobacteria bacterium]